MKGKFITFEGIEGSGKSCQLRLLKEELQRRGIPYSLTKEPGGTPFGQELRSILLHSEGPQREPLAELLLYLADRYQHLKEVIEPRIEEGFLVVSDRYHDATLVYQGHARGIGMDRISHLAEALELREPDLTLVLDLDVRLGLERARTRNEIDRTSHLGRFEAEDIRFHQKVREGYQILARAHPDRVIVIDAEGSPEEVFERVLETIARRFSWACKS